jgi:hypothetical protein
MFLMSNSVKFLCIGGQVRAELQVPERKLIHVEYFQEFRKVNIFSTTINWEVICFLTKGLKVQSINCRSYYRNSNPRICAQY